MPQMHAEPQEAHAATRGLPPFNWAIRAAPVALPKLPDCKLDLCRRRSRTGSENVPALWFQAAATPCFVTSRRL